MTRTRTTSQDLVVPSGEEGLPRLAHPVPSAADLLLRAWSLAELAQAYAATHEMKRLERAAHAGWLATSGAMAAVILHFTGRLPDGLLLRWDALQRLTEDDQNDLARMRRPELVRFRCLVSDAYADLYLANGDDGPWRTRSRLTEVRSELVPLGRKLCISKRDG